MVLHLYQVGFFIHGCFDDTLTRRISMRLRRRTLTLFVPLCSGVRNTEEPETVVSPETISLTANLATIISSFSIVIALYVYLKDRFEKNRRFDFGVPSKRKKYFPILVKRPSLIDKVVIDKGDIKGSKLSEILLTRYKCSVHGDREKILQNGLRFFLSDEAIKAFPNLDSTIYNNLDLVLSRFCSLVVDREDLFAPSAKRVDAWVELESIKPFIVKFPIPEDLFDEDVFSEIRFGRATISKLGSAIIQQYFLPYLIFYVAKEYDSFSKDDTYTVLSVLWEIGPS